MAAPRGPPSDSRQRGIFPLPSAPASLSPGPPLVRDLNFDSLSRKVQRRILRRGHHDIFIQQSCDALNSLSGHSRDRPLSSPTAAQKAARGELARAVTAMGPPTADLDPAGAFCELRGASVYEDPEAVVRPYVYDLVSLPPVGASPVVVVASALGKSGSSDVQGILSSDVLDCLSANREISDSGIRRPYMDDTLAHSYGEYARFIKRLKDCKVVSYHTADFVRERCGLFFVTKNRVNFGW